MKKRLHERFDERFDERSNETSLRRSMMPHYLRVTTPVESSMLEEEAGLARHDQT
jgi:hypothetical protein